MAPVPKRRHSTYRSGKRIAQRRKSLVQTIKCSNCGKPKLPHRICSFCGHYGQ